MEGLLFYLKALARSPTRQSRVATIVDRALRNFEQNCSWEMFATRTLWNKEHRQEPIVLHVWQAFG
jgi:hypothetical protein